MKNFGTLISLLIVGISSWTTAQTQIPNEDESYITMRAPPASQAGESTEYMMMISSLEERCNRNGGPGAFESAMKLPEVMKQCMKSVVDVEEFQMELEIALRRDNLGTVFKKYCKKIPEVEKCLTNMKDMLAPCFDAKEKGDLEVNDKMTAAVLEYICDKDGERITAFLAAGGLACIQSIRAPALLCAHNNLGQFTSFDLSSHPLMNLGREKCSKLEKFGTCTTKYLEECGSQTADFFKGLFLSVRRVTPCEEFASSQEAITQEPTGGSKNFGQEQKPVKSDVTVEELTKESLVKQIEAAEAQVRAANAQERAAVAQEQAARVVEQVGKTWLRKKSY